LEAESHTPGASVEGLEAAVRAVYTNTAGAYTVNADGNLLETYRAEDDGDDGYISEIEVLRGDFSQVLYDDTSADVEYVFGDRIAELTQDADGVDVTFASGQQRRFELVIGADGLHSAHYGRWSSGRARSSSGTWAWCWPSTPCPTSSVWTAG
jgi:2-polyprenyl-6-methoxyphenol hydroxylase-like FAD-dependent oxidoreductase